MKLRKDFVESGLIEEMCVEVLLWFGRNVSKRSMRVEELRKKKYE